MSELTDILAGRMQIKRFTANVVDKKAIVASISADRQPKASCRLVVEISGVAVAAGTVSVAGTTSESFSFSDNSAKVGAKDFSSISGVTVAGLTSGYVEIRAVTKTGQPLNQEKEIYASMPVRFYAIDRKQVRMIPPGQQKMAKYMFMAAPEKDVQENDLVYAISGVAGLTRGQVTFVETIFDFEGVTHHIEAEVMQL